MNRSPAILIAAALGISGLTLTSAPLLGAPAKAPAAKAPTAKYPRAAGVPSAPKGTVEPRAVEALRNMSRYLMTLQRFQLVSNGSLDVVTDEGQRIAVDGTATYDVKRPGFVIRYVSDLKRRDFYYDGKTFTMYSPKLDFYASVPAPPTNREVLDTVYNKYGIRLPLEDLFRWNDTGAARINQFSSAFSMGPSMQGDVRTTHYAFREPEIDWEIWIQDGNQPLPVKLVIVDRTDPARPTYTARLNWNLTPNFTDQDFTFKPGADSKRIQLAEYKG